MGVSGPCGVGASCLTNSRTQCLTHCMTSACNQVPLVGSFYVEVIQAESEAPDLRLSGSSSDVVSTLPAVLDLIL